MVPPIHWTELAPRQSSRRITGCVDFKFVGMLCVLGVLQLVSFLRLLVCDMLCLVGFYRMHSFSRVFLVLFPLVLNRRSAGVNSTIGMCEQVPLPPNSVPPLFYFFVPTPLWRIFRACVLPQF